MNTQHGMVRYLVQKNSPIVVVCVRYRVTRASGSNPAVKIGVLPYHRSLRAPKSLPTLTSSKFVKKIMGFRL